MADERRALGEEAHAEQPLLVEGQCGAAPCRQLVEFRLGLALASEPGVHVRKHATEGWSNRKLAGKVGDHGLDVLEPESEVA